MRYRSGMNPDEFVKYLQQDFQSDKDELIKQELNDLKKCRDKLLQFLAKLRFAAMSHQFIFVKTYGLSAYKKLNIFGFTPLEFIKKDLAASRQVRTGFDLVVKLSYLSQSGFFATHVDLDPYLAPIQIMPKDRSEEEDSDIYKKTIDF